MTSRYALVHQPLGKFMECRIKSLQMRERLANQSRAFRAEQDRRLVEGCARADEWFMEVEERAVRNALLRQTEKEWCQ